MLGHGAWPRGILPPKSVPRQCLRDLLRELECPRLAEAAALVSIGKHLGMFTDRVPIQERKQISAEPMSAEEWKRQYVREG
jgi:hypothetical protein